MVKAIIFDCFGVLVQGSLEQFIDNYLSHDQDLVRKAHQINDQCSLGLITYEEQIDSFSEMAKINVTEVHKQMDNNPRNSNLFDYIKSELKNNYKIGFLSNAGEDWLDELFTKEDIGLFDDFVLSYKVKMAKPDPRIFELSATNLGVAPAECIFIDDIDRYCTAAKDVGMQGIQYLNFGQMKQELEKILEVANTNK